MYNKREYKHLEERESTTKRMKKFSAILAVCLLCTACGRQPADTPTTGTNETPSLEVSASDAVISDDDASTDNATEPDETAATETAPVRIEVSGNHEDVIVTDCDCYIEGESVIIYLQKGLSVPGDILTLTEKVMQDLSEVSGLSFDKSYGEENPMECRDMYYEEGLFAEINKDAEKVNILVVDLEPGYVEWACDHNAILDVENYEYNYSLYQTIYHELSHVLHHRNGVGLSSTLNEGYATYLASKTLQAKGMADWNTIQHFFPMEFDDQVILSGEESFRAEFEDVELPYNYGFRLLIFLTDTYGDDIFAKILAEATRQEYDAGFDPNNKEASLQADSLQLISIIKSQTCDDVFAQFGTWYTENWSRLANEYMAYTETLPVVE